MPHHMTAALAHLPKVERGETMGDKLVRESTINCKVKFEGLPLTEEQQKIAEKAVFRSLHNRIQRSIGRGDLVVDIDGGDVYSDIYSSKKFGKIDITIERRPELNSINEGTVWFVVKAKSDAPRYIRDAINDTLGHILRKEVGDYLKQPDVDKRIREEITKNLVGRLGEILEQDPSTLKVEFKPNSFNEPLGLDVVVSSTIPAIQEIFDEMNKNGE